jgi:hypothetical protein
VIFSFVPIVHAAQISNVTIQDVTNDSATIDWTTDIKTDASVNYGLDASVGVIRDPSATSTAHAITIPNLDPFTTYYFRAVSTDPSGNTSATAGFVFTTKGTQADKAVQDISKITDPHALVQVANKVQQQAQTVILPPSIIGDPNITVGVDQAVVTWSTDRESDSEVNLAPDSGFSASAPSYSITQGNTGESVKKHSVTVIGLKPFTLYHFSVTSKDSLGLKGNSNDATFTTKATLPEVVNPKVGAITESSATITWSTGDVLAKGIVNYTNLRTKATESLGNPVYLTNQSVKITGLELGTRYQATITATNQAGDNIESTPFTFITSRDVSPPVITNVNNQSTLFADDDTKVQTILSWTTDKPTFCQVFFVLGLVKGGAAQTQNIAVESNPVTNHLQVLTGFTPGSVYKFWVQCHDAEGNQAQSDDYVLITPVQAKNIIDLILANFQGTFGWVGKVGK